MSGDRWTFKQIFVLSGLWFAFLISFITRLIWSTLMPLINTQMHFTVAQGTSFVTAFYLGYTLTVLPGGMLADKLGYRKLLLFAVAANAIVIALMGLMQGYWPGLTLRFILGLVSGPDLSACLGIIGEWFTAKKRATATGLFVTCTSFGIIIINIYAPYVAKAWGWRAAMFVTALIPVVLFLYIIISLIGEPPYKVQKRPHVSIKESFRQIEKACTSRSVIMLSIVGITATGAKWGVTNWANLFIVKNLGFSLVTAGQAMAFFGVTSVISMVVAGWISDHSKISRHIWSAIFLLVFTPAIIGFALSPKGNLAMLYFWTGLLGIGAFMFSTLTDLLSIEVAPDYLRGTVSGFVNVFNQVGSFIFPVLLGSLFASTGSYVTSFLVISVFPVIGFVALLFVKEDKNDNL